MATEAGFGGPQFASIANELQNVAFNFGAAAAAARELGAVVQTFRVFERELTLANAVAEGTVENFKQMEQQARRFALASKFTIAEVANSFYFLAAAGLSAEQAMAAASGVLVLSQATMTELGRSADLVSAALASFNLQASESLRVSNLFVAAANTSLASLEKLEFAFRQVGPVASSAGLGIEDTVAALNQLFDAGLRGEQAGTALRNVLVRLVNPVGNAEKILNKLGIATVDAGGNLRDLQAILQELYSKNLSQSTLAEIFGTEALAGATTLLNSAGTGKLKANLDAISGTQAAVTLAIKQMQTLDGAIARAGNALTELRLLFGEAFVDAIRAVLEGFVDFVRTLREVDPAILQVTGNMVAMATAAYLLYKALQFSGLLALATNLGLVSIAIRGLGTASLFAMASLGPIGLILAGISAAAAGASLAIAYFADQVDTTQAKLAAEELFGPLEDGVVQAKRVRDALDDMFPEDNVNGAVNRYNVLNSRIVALGEAAKASEEQIKKLDASITGVGTLNDQTGIDASKPSTFFTEAPATDLKGQVQTFIREVDSLEGEDEAIKSSVERLLREGDFVGALNIAENAKNQFLVRLSGDLKEYLNLRFAATNTINAALTGASKSQKEAFNLEAAADVFSPGNVREFGKVVEKGKADAELSIKEFKAQSAKYEQEVAQKLPEITKELLGGIASSKKTTDVILTQYLDDLQKNDPKEVQALIAKAVVQRADGSTFAQPDLFKKALIDRAIAFPRTLAKAQKESLERSASELGKTTIIIDEDSKRFVRNAEKIGVQIAQINSRLAGDIFSAYEAEQQALSDETTEKLDNLRAEGERIYEEKYKKSLNELFKQDFIKEALLSGEATLKSESGEVIKTLRLTEDNQQEYIDLLIQIFQQSDKYRKGDLLSVTAQIREGVLNIATNMFRERAAVTQEELAKQRILAQNQNDKLDKANEFLRGLRQENNFAEEANTLQKQVIGRKNLGVEYQIAELDARRSRDTQLADLERERAAKIKEVGTIGVLSGELEIEFTRKRKDINDKYNIEVAKAAATKGTAARELRASVIGSSAELDRLLFQIQYDAALAAYDVNPTLGLLANKYELEYKKIIIDVQKGREEFERELRSATNPDGTAQYSESTIKVALDQADAYFKALEASLTEKAKEAQRREIDALKQNRREWFSEISTIVAESYAQLAGALAANSGSFDRSLIGAGAANERTAEQGRIYEEFGDKINSVNEAFDQLNATYAEEASTLEILATNRSRALDTLNQTRDALIAYTNTQEYAISVEKRFELAALEKWIALKKGSDDFFGGFEAGMDLTIAQMPSDFENGIEASRILLDGLGDLFGSIFDGTAKDWKQMLANMLRELANFIARAVIMQAVVKPIMTALGFGLADGGVVGGSGGGSSIGGPTGNIVPFIGASAHGNVLSSASGNMFGTGGTRLPHPTIFDRDGRAMTTVLEEGPEAVLPLKRGKDGNLGVHAQISMAGNASQKKEGGNTYVVSPTFVNEIHTSGQSSSDAGDDDGTQMMRMLKNINESMTARITAEIAKQMRPGGIINSAASGRF